MTINRRGNKCANKYGSRICNFEIFTVTLCFMGFSLYLSKWLEELQAENTIFVPIHEA